MSLENHTFTINTKDPVRTETLEGREHWVVPIAMMVEGVWPGSDGPLFYPSLELNRAVPSWNHKPIVVYHPMKDGKGCSAATPEVLNTQKVGVLLNTRWDGKQRTEGWIDKERCAVVDSRVSAAIINRTPMEVSTGLFVDKKELTAEMTFNEKTYKAEAINHRPDHLAILPDQLGACSLLDGAGMLTINNTALRLNHRTSLSRGVVWNTLLNNLTPDHKLSAMIQNEMSHSNIWSALSAGMRPILRPVADESSLGWIEDVYDDFFIYSLGDKLYKRFYYSNEAGVTITDDPPIEVARVTRYEMLDGTPVGNQTTAPPLADFLRARLLINGERTKGIKQRIAQSIR